ncbi:unnamed protein product, partial [marine sediment metagenome]
DKAIFTPMTLSIRIMSDKMLSVIVGEGYWYAPVYIQVLIPSCSNALAFIKRAFNDLANPSVCAPKVEGFRINGVSILRKRNGVNNYYLRN